ncbi:ParA family protein [Alicyclobacillus acidocaldarius]|uniref:AAA domain-containing protein n=1 Tax=Alicyclobacillus acidocaldarius (strain Tc-4-1) TaxID=1048834 RepID=F8IGP8_ALIAT|nr:ParA family protein [Alicyclobacillus acidocaldarius]AEJ44328.1 hypothetical protein TC41_2429 [Alicyclobacillus acidocaldarius subsp. acidocaldarius Tc-4-1]
MADPLEVVLSRYEDYTSGQNGRVNIPSFRRYVITNFRGGVGKTSLTFNLGYELALRQMKVLFVDACPQMNLSEILLRDNVSVGPDLYGALISEIMPTGQTPSQVGMAARVGGTCPAFAGHDAYLLKGSTELYLFAGTLHSQLSTAASLMHSQASSVIRHILLSLSRIAEREEVAHEIDRVLFDTSPFFNGATQLSWMAADALIVPIRVDHASIVGLSLVFRMLNDPSMDLIKYMRMSGIENLPKIHSIVVTHANWSRRKRFEPDAATRHFLNAALQLAMQYPSLFGTGRPEDHVFLLDDFLSAGKISGERSIPICELQPGQQFSIRGQKLNVNESVERYKNQLKFLAATL